MEIGSQQSLLGSRLTALQAGDDEQHSHGPEDDKTFSSHNLLLPARDGFIVTELYFFFKSKSKPLLAP
jgi:hypothetical protein